MTPGPITAAAAGSKRPAAEAAEERGGAKRRVRPSSGPRPPRRISGPLTRRDPPAGGTASAYAGRLVRSAGAAVAARAEAIPRPASRPVARPKIAPRPTVAPRPERRSAPQPIVRRLIASLGSLPDHAVLDRLVRGRAWIPVLGLLLTGIVAMQVEVLKISAGIGRSMADSSQLQIRNEQLSTTVASLADDQRIQRLAAAMGMVMPHTGMVGFLTALPAGSLQQATANIHAPDLPTFMYSAANYGSSSSNGVVVTPAGLQALAGITVGGGTGSSTIAGSTTPGGVGSSTTATSTAGTSTQTPLPAQAPGTSTVGSPAGSGSATGAPGGGAAGGGVTGQTGGGTSGGGAPASGTSGGGTSGGGTSAGGTSGGGASGSTGSGTNGPATGAASIQPSGSAGG